MQLTCRRCQTTYSLPGSTTSPCPSCGSLDVSTHSPMAATTERPAAAFSAPVSQPAPQQPAPPLPLAANMVPYGAPQQPQAPYQPPYGNPYGAAPYAGPYGQPPMQPMQQPMQQPMPWPQQQQQYMPYPQQSVQVVIQNQINAPYPMPMPQYALAPPARRKDAGVATLLSFFLPGGGQFYNGQTGKGLAFLFVTIFLNFPLMFVGVGFFTGLITWIWAMVDAHQSAERINRGELVV